MSPPLRASNEGLLRPRVARAQETHRVIPLPSAARRNAARSRRMLKKSVSKAATDGSTGGVAPGYVEDAFEVRTQLADFFSIPAASPPFGLPETAD